MAEAQAPAIPAATLEKLMARATAQFASWKATSTPEQKASGLAKLERFKNDEAYKNEEMAKFTKMYTDADTNGDGKLDRAEYTVFADAVRAAKAAEGEWDDQENFDDVDYEMMNSISEGDGFTMADMWTIFGPWMAKFEELKAADGQ